MGFSIRVAYLNVANGLTGRRPQLRAMRRTGAGLIDAFPMVGLAGLEYGAEQVYSYRPSTVRIARPGPRRGALRAGQGRLTYILASRFFFFVWNWSIGSRP